MLAVNLMVYRNPECRKGREKDSSERNLTSQTCGRTFEWVASCLTSFDLCVNFNEQTRHSCFFSTSPWCTNLMWLSRMVADPKLFAQIGHMNRVSLLCLTFSWISSSFPFLNLLPHWSQLIFFRWFLLCEFTWQMNFPSNEKIFKHWLHWCVFAFMWYCQVGKGRQETIFSLPI